MKKGIALLLTMMLVIGLMSAALAYDDEITFQGIPWGSEHAEVVKQLIEKGFIPEDVDEDIYSLRKEDGNCLLLWKQGGHATKRTANNWEPYEDYGEWLSCVYYQNPLKKVGGYEMGDLSLSYCVDGEKARLVCVGFKAVADNPDEAYQDLLKKLNKVYGKGKEFNDRTYEITTWSGAENTAVLLEHYIPGDVYIYYGTLRSEDWFIEAARDVLNTPVPHNDVEDTTDGL